jgi:membrane-associated protease RseP (regulator of RpoE activity)
MVALATVLGLAALLAVHELVVYALARAAGAEAKRRVAIVLVRGRRRGALAFAGGAAAGYLAAAAMAFAYYACHGIETGRRFYAVGEVRRGYDAVGKLEAGDRIVAVDGEPLSPDSGRSLVERVNAKSGASVTLAIQRGGARVDVVVQPLRTGHDTWLLGIRPFVDHETVTDVGGSLGRGLELPLANARYLAHQLRESLTSHDADPGGPKRIVDEYEPRNAAPDWSGLLRLAASAWLALAVLDLVRAVWLLRPRRA